MESIKGEARVELKSFVSAPVGKTRTQEGAHIGGRSVRQVNLAESRLQKFVRRLESFGQLLLSPFMQVSTATLEDRLHRRLGEFFKRAQDGVVSPERWSKLVYAARDLAKREGGNVTAEQVVVDAFKNQWPGVNSRLPNDMASTLRSVKSLLALMNSSGIQEMRDSAAKNIDAPKKLITLLEKATVEQFDQLFQALQPQLSAAPLGELFGCVDLLEELGYDASAQSVKDFLHAQSSESFSRLIRFLESPNQSMANQLLALEHLSICLPENVSAEQLKALVAAGADRKSTALLQTSMTRLADMTQHPDLEAMRLKHEKKSGVINPADLRALLHDALSAQWQENTENEEVQAASQAREAEQAQAQQLRDAEVLAQRQQQKAEKAQRRQERAELQQWMSAQKAQARLEERTSRQIGTVLGYFNHHQGLSEQRTFSALNKLSQLVKTSEPEAARAVLAKLFDAGTMDFSIDDQLNIRKNIAQKNRNLEAQISQNDENPTSEQVLETGSGPSCRLLLETLQDLVAQRFAGPSADAGPALPGDGLPPDSGVVQTGSAMASLPGTDEANDIDRQRAATASLANTLFLALNQGVVRFFDSLQPEREPANIANSTKAEEMFGHLLQIASTVSHRAIPNPRQTLERVCLELLDNASADSIKALFQNMLAVERDSNPHLLELLEAAVVAEQMPGAHSAGLTAAQVWTTLKNLLEQKFKSAAMADFQAAPHVSAANAFRERRNDGQDAAEPKQ